MPNQPTSEQVAWKYVRVTYGLTVIAVAIYYARVFGQSEAGFLGSLLVLSAILPMIIAWRLPLVGLCVFSVATYCLPRYGTGHQMMLNLGLLNWLVGFTLTGCIIYLWQRRERVHLKNWLVLSMAALAAWTLVALFVAWTRNPSLSFPPLRHPENFVQGWILMLVAVHVLETRKNTWIFGLVLCLIPFLRTINQGRAGIYLDGDVAALCVITFPIALIGTRFASMIVFRGVFLVLSVLLLGILALDQNRGAAIGLAFAITFLWWNSQRRIAWVLAAIPIVIAGLYLVPHEYFDRFIVFFDTAAKHATAGLDRATVDERFQLWIAAWQMFVDHYGFGVGPGNSAAVLEIYRPGSWGLPTHNSLLDVATETGIVGLVLYCSVFFGAIYLMQSASQRGIVAWPQPEIRMVQAALAAYIGVGLFLSRHDMQLAYILVGWAAALLRQRDKLAGRNDQFSV